MDRLFYNALALWACIATLSFAGTSVTGDRRESTEKHIELLTSFDRTVIDKTFHELLADTAVGYVLCGNKPIYLETFSNDLNLFAGTPPHKWAVTASQLACTWKKLRLGPNGNYFLLILDFVESPNEIMLINRKAFLDVVNENLLLFKQHLGLKVTAESLLNRLLVSKESLFSILNKNTALLGIVLGYGTENSLFFERGSLLTQQILENSPLSPLLQACSPPQNDTEVIEMFAHSKSVPSFGYSSINEEINDPQNLMDTFVNNNKNIAFTHLKNSNESSQLIKNYREDLASINELMNSRDFLGKILERFGTCSTIFESKDNLGFDSQQLENMSQWVARSIWKQLTTISQDALDPTSTDYFIAGMQKAANTQLVDAEDGKIDIAFFDRFYHQRADEQIQRKLDDTKKYFSQLAFQNEGKCIVPSKLYYQTISSGIGDGLKPHATKIFAHYVIRDMNGEILHGTYKLGPLQAIDLSLAIPGLAHGVVGMKKNEIREIFIHPDFAYGVYSDFGSGKAICVQIELLDFETDLKQQKLPELIPIDLQHIANEGITSKSHLDQLEKEYLFFSGFRTWTHYSKAAGLIDLDEVLESVNRMQESGQTDILFSEIEIKTLKKLHWLIYHSVALRKTPNVQALSTPSPPSGGIVFCLG